MATQTTRFAATHGAPEHISDPAAIGIEDIDTPGLGSPVTIMSGLRDAEVAAL